MSEQRDPARWMDDPELAGELRRDLASYAAEAPTLEGRARMFAGLEQELALAPSLSSAASAAELANAARVTSGAGKLKLALSALALLAGTLSLFMLWPTQTARPFVHKPGAAPARASSEALPVIAEVPEVQLQEPTTQLVRAPLPAQLVPRERSKLKRVLALSVRAPQSALEQHRKPVAARPPLSELDLIVKEPQVDNTRADPVAELALLAQARRALLSRPAHALEFTEVHARDYPQGTFGEEREVLAIESLVRLGLTDEAKRRVAAFEQRFPNSAQRAHLTRMMAPLSP